MKIKRLILLSFLLLLGAFLFYIWYGFLFPDPFFVSYMGFSGKLIYLWLPRILIPIFYFVLMALFAVKSKKMAQNIAVMILTVFIIVLIAYPILDIGYFYKLKSKNKISSDKYHPFLQLNPPSTFRLDSVSIESGFTIFCLGGSTTEWPDSHGTSWPLMLEKELRQLYGTDTIMVFNFGKQWYTSLHTLINYETNLRQLNPDVIILMHNINDLLQNADFSYLSKSRFREDYGHFMGPSRDIFANDGLFFGSYMTNFKHMWYFKHQRITIEQDTFPGLESYTRNINNLIDLASVDCTKVVLMTQPNIYSVNMDDETKKRCVMVNYEAVGKEKRWGYQTAYNGLNQYNQKIKGIAEERGVYFIDLDSCIPKSLIYFKDDVHYTDTTYTIICKIIAKRIKDLDLVSR